MGVLRRKRKAKAQWALQAGVQAGDRFALAIQHDHLHAPAHGANQLNGLWIDQWRGRCNPQCQREPHHHPAGEVLSVAKELHGHGLWPRCLRLQQNVQTAGSSLRKGC